MSISHLNKMMYSYGNYFIKSSKFLCPINNKYFNKFCMCSTNSDANKLSAYNDVDQSYILNVLNENSTCDLSRYSISKTRIKRLDQYRIKRGKFDNLEAVLEVDGMGIKVLDKFYKSILDIRDNKNPIEKTPKGKKKNLGFLTPPLTEDIRHKTSAIVSIHISLNAVSWCLINKSEDKQITIRSCNLHDFKQENKRMSFSQTLQLALNIAQLIPDGDIYVFEALQNTMMNPSSVNTNYVRCERINLLSMLSAILANRKQLKQNNNTKYNIPGRNDCQYHETIEEHVNDSVYFLRNMLPARLFKTVVGSESISTEPIVLELFRNSHQEMPHTNSVQPKILQPVIDLYYTLNAVHREIFRQALLLGLTCMNVCILLDEASIETLATRQ